MTPKLTTEQLIKFLEENKEAPASKARNTNDVHRFINSLDIKAGKHSVRNNMVYKAYQLWSIKPYTQRAFFKRFSYYFSPNHNGHWRHYNLNYTGVQLLNKIDNGKIKI